MLKCLFKKLASLRPAALLKKKTPAQVFSQEFWEIFYNTYCVIDYRILYKKGVVKNPVKFMAKIQVNGCL